MYLSPDLLRWARAHHQLVTRDVWIDAGRSRRSFDRAVANGALVRMAPNVALLAGADPTRAEPRIAAVVLSSRRRLVASHGSAAFLWGAAVSGVDPVEVTVADRSSSTRSIGVVVHRPTDRDDLRAIVRQGIGVTDPLRTLVDLGASHPDAVAGFLETLLIQGTVTYAGAQAVLDRHRRRGRTGIAALTAAVEDLALEAKPPDSVLEPAMARLFGRFGLDGWVFHPVVGGYELDFAFPDVRLDVEVDGWDPHGPRRSFEDDRARDGALVALGWSVLRLTWRQVMRRPAKAAALLRAAIACRR